MANRDTFQRGAPRQRHHRTGASHGARPRSASKAFKALLAREGIDVPIPTDVLAYLRSHRRLATLVPQVCSQARKEFGPDAELILKLYRDPEIKDRHLSLYVRLRAYDDTVLQRMDRVSAHFADELCSASGFLVITTDLRPARVRNGV